MNTTASNVTTCCDRCGRPIGAKGYVEVNGWIICGVCQWEESIKNNSTVVYKPSTENPPAKGDDMFGYGGIMSTEDLNKDVCPKCGSDDIVITVYCNKCQEAI